MMLLEDEGKALFRDHGIPVPVGRTIVSSDQIVDVDLPAVVKALVPVGGRGKAGDVSVVATQKDLKAETDRILGMSISGNRVRSVLIENVLDIAREMYLSILIDRSLGIPVLMAAPQGGVDVESLPDGAMRRWPVHPFLGVGGHHGRQVAAALGLRGREKEVERLLNDLWAVFVSSDSELVEINPLIITKGDNLVAADAKVAINDDSLYRHPELSDRPLGEDELEAEARRRSISFVRLDGDIGVIANGAGLTLATLDEIALHGSSAAAFMDLGGTDDPTRVEESFGLMVRSAPDVILLNVFGGITRCDTVAKGVLRALERNGRGVPIVARIRGINESEARKMLMAAGIPAHLSLDDAVKEAIRMVNRE